MRSNYKKLGDYIQQVSIKNKELAVSNLLGVSITKEFIPSIANTVGTDMSKYKIVQKGQFAYGPVTSRNGDKISVALLEDDSAIVSSSYTVFEIIDENELLPEYLIMWFRREEFDRYARYMSHGSTREVFGWEEMCEVELPIPSIEKQREIVAEYYAITNRIKLNEQLNQKLEETAQAIYKEWFVDFEFPHNFSHSESSSLSLSKCDSESDIRPYKSGGGEMVWCDELEKEIPKGWKKIFLKDLMNVKHGFAYKGEFFSEKENENILLTPGNVEIGGGFKNDKFKYYYGKVPKDYIFKPNDIMVTMTDLSKASDTLGLPAFIPQVTDKKFLHNQRLGKLEFFNESYKYIVYLLMCAKDYQHFVVSGATGTTVKHTSPTKILEYSFSFMDDVKLLRLFNSVVIPIFSLIENKKIENQKLLALKEVLLSKMAIVEG